MALRRSRTVVIVCVVIMVIVSMPERSATETGKQAGEADAPETEQGASTEAVPEIMKPEAVAKAKAKGIEAEAKGIEAGTKAIETRARTRLQAKAVRVVGQPTTLPETDPPGVGAQPIGEEGCLPAGPLPVGGYGVNQRREQLVRRVEQPQTLRAEQMNQRHTARKPDLKVFQGKWKIGCHQHQIAPIQGRTHCRQAPESGGARHRAGERVRKLVAAGRNDATETGVKVTRLLRSAVERA